MLTLIRLWPLWLAVLTGVAGYATGWEFRDRSADIKSLRADKAELTDALAYTNRTLEAERSKARELADIGTDHEKDRRDAQDVPAAVVAGLQSGALQLRDELAGCETQRLSDAAAAAAQPDAAARVREAIAGAIVQVGRDADDQVRALQAVAEADRK